MPFMTLTAQYVGLAGTDYSSYCNQAELTVDVDEGDVTTFASNGWKEVLGGLKSAQLAIGLKNDVASGRITQALWPQLGEVVTFELRMTQAAVGADNPSWTGKALIKSLKVGGQVGSVHEASLTFPTSGAVTMGVV